MIVTLEETKQYLRVDGNEDDELIAMLIDMAEKYLFNATGKTFDSTNYLAKLFCWALVTDLYENRGYVGQSHVIERVRPVLQSMLVQLRYCDEGVEE